MMEQIEQLGREVDASWKKEQYAQEAISEIASRALQKHRMDQHFSIEALLRWLLRTRTLPEQLQLTNGFGEPPITLFRNEHFLIDIYFWINPITTIHSHGFSGAFSVLRGRKLHCHYAFQIRDKIEERLQIGELHLKETKLLKAGDIQTIDTGPKGIHQVWQLDRPTVTLLIRPYHPIDAPPFTYMVPHLAFQNFEVFPPLQKKQIDLTVMLHRTQHPSKEETLNTLVSKAGHYWGFLYLLAYFTETHDFESITKILERNPQFRRWGPAFREALTTLSHMKVNWPNVKDEGERLLLALLHTFDCKEDIMDFIRMVFPGRNLERSILDWLKGLMDRKAVDFELNKTALDILKLNLQGTSEQELYQKLARRYNVKNSNLFRRDIQGFRHQLSTHELLKPLFSPPKASPL